MKLNVMTACVLAFFPLAALSPAHAQQPQQTRMQTCAGEWDAMKAANQAAGKTYRAFQKECLARTAAAPAAPPPAPPAAQAAPATRAAPAEPATKASGGRQAMLARERACGAEWKAAKAAGTVQTGMTWPKYWSECNTRKKAQGL